MDKTFIFENGSREMTIRANTQANAWVMLAKLIGNVTGWKLKGGQG